MNHWCHATTWLHYFHGGTFLKRVLDVIIKYINKNWSAIRTNSQQNLQHFQKNIRHHSNYKLFPRTTTHYIVAKYLSNQLKESCQKTNTQMPKLGNPFLIWDVNKSSNAKQTEIIPKDQEAAIARFLSTFSRRPKFHLPTVSVCHVQRVLHNLQKMWHTDESRTVV